MLHVSISLLLSLTNGSRGAQDGHLIQLQELLTQAVLQVLVQLAAGTQYVRHILDHRRTSHGKSKMTPTCSDMQCDQFDQQPKF